MAKASKTPTKASKTPAKPPGKAKTPVRSSARTAKKDEPAPPSPLEEAALEEAALEEAAADDSASSDSDSEDEAVISAINTAAAAISKKFPDGAAAKKKGNELTFLIPGYTAPMSLSAGASQPLYIDYTKVSATKKAKLDAATPAASFDYSRFDDAGVTNPASAHQQALTEPTSEAASHIMKNTIKHKPTGVSSSAGDKWFGFESQLDGSREGASAVQRTADAEALKKDLQVIRMRNYIDPKKFYKSSDKPSNFAQLGTVISHGSEYFSGRLTKAERRTTLLDEVMSDRGTRDYASRKFKEVQKKKESGGKKWRKSMDARRSKAGNVFQSRKKTF
jgi:hypothetical protein